MPKAKKNILGAWAFLIGVVVAILVGLLGLTGQTWITVLLILGVLIGLLNVGGSELKDFMLAGTVLALVSYIGGQGLLNLTISVVNIGAILQALVALFVPATIIVALKSVFVMARR
jgi:hypothetical protein